MTYDAYGNITAVKDAEGRVSETVYDQYFLHPAVEKNALGHEASAATGSPASTSTGRSRIGRVDIYAPRSTSTPWGGTARPEPSASPTAAGRRWWPTR
jgi:hypothetical protein